jgi:hypothetical protein
MKSSPLWVYSGHYPLMISYELIPLSTSPFQPCIMSPNLPLTIYTILSSYCLVGCLMEHFVVFPGWLLVSPADIADGSLMIYVVPKSVLTIFLIYIWASTAELTTAPVPTLSLYFSLAMMTISWISSFAVQIPLQLRIREEKDKGLVRTLIRTDWVRVLSMVAYFGAVIWTVAA